MDDLRTWVITLVSVTIVCSIIERFAPQGNLNKYVKLVCGLVVTVVIIKPALDLLKGDMEIDSVAWNQYVKMSEKEFKSRVERLQEEDLSQMLELYRISLINDVKTRFKGYSEFIVAEADAVLYEDARDERFGLIRSLYLSLKPAEGNKTKTINPQTVTYVKKQLAEAFAIDDSQIIIDISAFSGG